MKYTRYYYEEMINMVKKLYKFNLFDLDDMTINNKRVDAIISIIKEARENDKN